MEIRNNLLSDLKKYYLAELNHYYDKREGESLITILLEYYFNVSRNDLILNPGIRISESEILKLHMAVKELKKMKPVQYIIGEADFLDLKLKVDSSVLIPRQETEELVNLIIGNERQAGLSILDIGTGSGCISISVAQALRESKVFATDISSEALAIAKINAMTARVNVSFIKDDILNTKLDIAAFVETSALDIIISNPPYVTELDKTRMHSNVLDYEPHSALFVPNNNPLIFYDAIYRFADQSLVGGGRVYFEINESLANDMIHLSKEYGYENINRDWLFHVGH